MNVPLKPPVAAATPVAPPMNPRTRALLQGPIVPTLFRLAWPNVLIMFAQAATGLIETFWVGMLGTDALAGMALVFPGVMLMQMFSAGAMGGGISSAIARALGAGKRDEADALVLHALAINLAIGLAFTAALLLFGRPLYRAMAEAMPPPTAPAEVICISITIGNTSAMPASASVPRCDTHQVSISPVDACASMIRMLGHAMRSSSGTIGPCSIARVRGFILAGSASGGGAAGATATGASGRMFMRRLR